jgi:hypothetical protein
MNEIQLSEQRPELKTYEPIKQFQMIPTNFAELKQYAEVLSKSELVPPVYRGKPDNIMVAMDFGARLGLYGLAALQSILPINGNPSIPAKKALNIIRRHPEFVSIEEVIQQEGCNKSRFDGERQLQEI